MTVREYLLGALVKLAEERLEKLVEYRAPQVMIDGQQKYVASLKAGELKISGDTDVLDEEFVDRELKKGRGGKGYVSINSGTINFFPNAKYGMYIKRA